MLNNSSFRQYAHQLADWIADYYEHIEQYPVKAQVNPKAILEQLPEQPPLESETMAQILQDFEQVILQGITHWQSPNFFAYFPANASYPSLLAEMLMSAIGAQCMIWDTSPVAAELEECVMEWLRQMLGLPKQFTGVIQDTASTATLCALLTAREQHTNFAINQSGFEGYTNFRVYCSTQTHSSIEKAVKIAGIGKENLVKIPVHPRQLSLEPHLLKAAIESDIQNGKHPLCVMVAMGTTSTLAIDPLEAIANICQEHNIWLHIDAAYAGSALILPEYRWMIRGIEQADSFVFNPHKWLFTNFDCSAYFVKNTEALLQTFSILPEYLKTATRGQVNDYRDWGIPLGRRFRALKLWFVIRNFGVKGLQEKIRTHIQLTKKLVQQIEAHPEFELLSPPFLNLACFHFVPKQFKHNIPKLNELNEQLLRQLNASGQLYLTHTKVNGQYALRMVIGQTNVEEKHVQKAWQLISSLAAQLITN